MFAVCRKNTAGVLIETKLKMMKDKWHVVEFAGWFHIMDEPFYDAKDVLNAEDVGYEQAKYNADLLVNLHNAGMPSDKEVSEWYELNIDNDSASSAIYKFRMWLKERV
jgi:hypothetical protein